MSGPGIRGAPHLLASAFALAALVGVCQPVAGARAQGEPKELSAAGRAEVAAQAAKATLQLLAPAHSWRRLAEVPPRERPLIGEEVPAPASSEERGKTQTRASVWVTRSTPREVIAYVRSRLPRDAQLMGESSSGTASPRTGPIGPDPGEEIQRRLKPDAWGATFTLPAGSDVLRSRGLGVYIALALHGRFVVEVVADAVWEGVRPAYSLLGANVHEVTITNTFAADRDAGPSPLVLSDPPLVAQLLAAVDAIPVFEEKNAIFSCPTMGPAAPEEAFTLSFAEAPGAAPLATLRAEPYACNEVFLPVISVPGEPPLELTPEASLVEAIDKATGLHLPASEARGVSRKLGESSSS
jgi:hypothetical protein